MILKKEKKEKKIFNLNKFLFIYFLFTLIVGVILPTIGALFLFFSKDKDKVLRRSFRSWKA